MLRLISIGSLAALFFSSTFVINRALSLQGGHWAWTSSLRFGFMLLMLVVILLATQGKKALADVKDIFFKHWLFWVLSGSIGFGVFYALITFSSQYAAGWVVATTWQTTILATPLVLLLFGRSVPRNGLLFTGIIFIGIVLVNIEHATLTSLHEVLLSALPVLGAAFAYPIGNQLVWESRKGNHPRLPHIQHPILDNAFARVLLLTLGSLPFWAGLLLVTSPPAPSADQFISTALVALLSGVLPPRYFYTPVIWHTNPTKSPPLIRHNRLRSSSRSLGKLFFWAQHSPTGWAWLALCSLSSGWWHISVFRTNHFRG